MADDLVRVRLTRLPPARDLEYLVLRYLRVNGIYVVPLSLAVDLVELGYALPDDGPDPPSELANGMEGADDDQ
jgi:hypothetical protein